MLAFRKSRSQLQSETLDIQYNPPPDGAYPPRLLALISSIWLPDGQTLTLINNRATIRREGSGCLLAPMNNNGAEILVNGQPLYLPRPLKDGDFIQWRKERFIFQADPVADRKKRIASWGDELLTPQPSQWLQERVVIDQSGISLDGGENFTHWDELSTLDVKCQGGRCTVKIHRMRAGQTKQLTTKLRSVKSEEFHQFILWLYLKIPFDLSIFEFGTNIGDWFPNAYFAAASEKLYVSSQNNQRVLPTDVNFIFHLPTRRERIMGWLALIGVLMIPSAGLALLNYRDRFFAAWISYTIIFVGFGLLYLAANFAFSITRKGLKKIRRRN